MLGGGLLTREMTIAVASQRINTKAVAGEIGYFALRHCSRNLAASRNEAARRSLTCYGRLSAECRTVSRAGGDIAFRVFRKAGGADSGSSCAVGGQLCGYHCMPNGRCWDQLWLVLFVAVVSFSLLSSPRYVLRSVMTSRTT